MKDLFPGDRQVSIKLRILPVFFAMALVCAYQLFWLIGEYEDLSKRLYEDIQEVLRSSDFEELVHRVDAISRMEYRGEVDVRLGYDHKEKSSLVQSEHQGEPGHDSKDENSITASPADFGSILKSPDDLKKIGLNMQRGIHSSLDAIMEKDLKYLDRILTDKLRNLGLSGDHRLLYLKSKQGGDLRMPSGADTLERLGDFESRHEETFRLEISNDSEYVMVIPRWRAAVMKQMMPVIVFSAVTFVLLMLTAWYLIHTMRRQKELEEIKTDFTNNITHELKTPIAVAYAANDSLLNFDATRNTPRMNRYLSVCQEQLRLLDRLVEQILSLSMERRQSLILNIEEVSVRELVESIVSNFRIKHEGNALLDVEVEEGLTLSADRMHLSNIIGNLVDNAIKYSRGQASVTLRAWRDRKGRVVIEVADKGIGITGEQQKHIFDKFYRVPHGNIHNVKGYGLGLFYVRSMTERLGGSVSVKSEYGKGSCFTLKFSTEDCNGPDKNIVGRG